MGRGKSKSRREVTLADPHGASSRLPPAPSSKDFSAVPNKLRCIMQLKQSTSVADRTRKGPVLEKGAGSAVVGTSPSINAISGKVMGGRKQALKETIRSQEKSKPRASEEANQGGPEVTEKAGKRKRKRKGEEDLIALAEKFKAVPARQGLQQKRKRYLEEKKKKKKKGPQLENLLPLNEHEKIEFGDIVEAPPKLSFPAKAKQKLEAVSQERRRLEAIDAYRAKRNWDFGAKLPELKNVEQPEY